MVYYLNNLMKKISTILLLMLLISCKQNKPQKIKITCNVPSKFQMYKASEMAALMRAMVQEHRNIKKLIQKHKPIGDFNQNYLKLHTAQLTDYRDRDASFESFSKSFIVMHKQLYKTEPSKQKQVYNSIINLCISCHQTHCPGSIPKIKPLLLP